jgi:polyhydroxyalkanoate synthase subunit PhaC
MASDSNDLRETAAAGAGFEAVLAAAAFRGFGRMLPARQLGTLAGALLREPHVAGRQASTWAQSVRTILADGDDLTAKALGRDPRFADRAWQDNAVLNRLARTYLASCDAVLGVVAEADIDAKSRERLRLPAERHAMLRDWCAERERCRCTGRK